MLKNRFTKRGLRMKLKAHQQNNSSMTMLKKVFFGCTLFITILAISVLSHASETPSLEDSNYSPSASSLTSAPRKQSEPIANSTNQSSVRLTMPNGKGEDGKSLEYIHCGPKYATTTKSMDNGNMEFILLHGAKFTKEDWATSGILDEICLEGGISAVAVDLSVRADGDGFRDAFRALVDGGILSGKPLTVISPSASGKAIVSLGSKAIDDVNVLKDLIKIWIPVASPAVLSVKDDAALKSFSAAGIEILAIHGDKDAMGEKVTKRLEDVVGAKSVELSGGHPVYLDSPHEFVETVLNFVKGQLSQS